MVLLPPSIVISVIVARAIFVHTKHGVGLRNDGDSAHNGSTDGLSLHCGTQRQVRRQSNVVGDDGADGDASASPAATEARVVLVREAEEWAPAIVILHVRAGTQRISGMLLCTQSSAGLSSTGAFGSGGASAGYDDDDAENVSMGIGSQ